MRKTLHQVLFPEADLNTLYKTKLLVIGVGGIGCEVLKVISKFPLAQIHIVDMDTIEASNLNRQFLFKQHHRGHSKSMTAREALLELHPKLNVVAHHLNIKQLKIGFFKQFDFFVMALDNVDARYVWDLVRNYVNKVGVRLNIPIVDAGTLGYKGNANTIIPMETACYACEEKTASQTVFPVCTIRSRPEKPIHCVMWAKLLFEVFFGPDNEDNDLNDLKEFIKNEHESKEDSVLILEKLFHEEIQGLKNLKNQAEQEKDKDGTSYINFSKKLKPIPKEHFTPEVQIESSLIDIFSDFDKPVETSINIELFKESYGRLQKQKKSDGFIVFEKDDDNIIHFVASAANLRMQCFSIDPQNFYQVKNMAGNIIPAIASTNSIVSGLEIIEVMKLITKNKTKLKSYFVQNLHTKVIPMKLDPPNPTCKVCSKASIPVIVETNLQTFTCNDLVEIVKKHCKGLEEFSINVGSNELYNSEEPRESILIRTINSIILKEAQPSKTISSAEFLLTNEQTSQRVCNIWVIDSAEPTEPRIFNGEQLQISENHQKAQNGASNNNHTAQDDDSDDLMFLGDECKEDSGDEVEIVEVRKRTYQQDKMDIEENSDEVKKYVKID